LANNVFQVKRTNTAGRTPNTTGSYATNSQYIAAGEFALNMADGILYTSNGSALIEVGGNNTNQNITGNLSLSVNNKRITFTPLAGGSNVYFTQQNDDNFVFYTTNTTNGSKAVFNVFSNTNAPNQNSAFRLNVPLDIQSNPLYANNSQGSAGQYLTSNGSATYWSSPGVASVNTAAQYTWSNTHTFNGNVNMTYAVFANTNGQLNATAGDFKANAYALLGGAGGNYLAIGQQSNFAQWIQSGYSNPSAVYYNIIFNPLGGNVGIGNTAPTHKLRVDGDISTNGGIHANGSVGSAGQYLTSNGTVAYWSSPGAVSVNTAAQYTWTNLHTFQANVAFTGNGIGITSNTGAIYFNSLTDANWKIGRNTGGTTKFFYTNNSLDIIAANSPLEGIAFGFTGNSYLETGYAGTYTRLPIYVGNSTVNVTINSTSFTGTANNTTNLGGTAAANFVQNTDSRTLSGNLVISGTYFNPSANTILLGNSTQRWVISANSGDFSSTVNAVTSVNSALLTVGTAFIANTTGAYHTGTINAASHTTTGITANATGVYPTSNTSGQNLGTATQRFDAFLDAVDVSGTITTNAGANSFVLSNNTSKWVYFTAGGAGAPTTTTRSDGTKIVIWPSLGASAVDYAIGTDNFEQWYSVGQTTARHAWYANTTSLMIANTTGLYHIGTINAASHTVGTTAVVNSTAIYFGTINATSNGITANATSINIGNSSVNSTINSTAFTGTANDATNLGGTAASGYQTTAGLAANVATLAANSASYTTSINGGLAGSIPYQNAPGVTTFVTIGTNTFIMTSNGTAPQWTNPTSVTVGTANNSSYLGGNLPAYYTNATNITTGTLPWAQAPSGTVNTSGSFTFSNTQTFSANITTNGLLTQNGISVRVVDYASGTTLTMNCDSTDLANSYNTQAAGTLTINPVTGTARDGQKLMLRLRSSNVQTFAWNTSVSGAFAGSTDLSLPTASSGSSKYDYMGFIYSTATSRWHLLAKNFGF